ncbi:MAG: 4-(cytidine 5'-diphospho)-2-C-methyl-D-erythritol kinase [Proteocatella sp.]
MDSINIIARAKVNLSLEVKGKREDGYHLLSMVMQSIELHDNITIAINKTGKINIDSNVNFIPKDERNIAYKAALLFNEESGLNIGYDIFIKKNIPSGAGMGGGSADAAGVLVALNKLNGELLSDEKLMQIGLKLGADVPFCMVGGTKLAEGIGEEFTELRGIDMKLLIVKPDIGISTAQAFKRLKLDQIKHNPNTENLIAAINKNNKTDIYKYMDNALYDFSLELVPEMESIINTLVDFGSERAMMTGSGSTVFGIFENENKLKKAYNYFSKLYKDVYITNTTKESITLELNN